MQPRPVVGRIATIPAGHHGISIFLLSEDIWQEEIPYILTSGMLSVGGDFSHFKQNNGIILSEKCRIFETSKPSPFDYPNYALWYLTQDMPLPSDKDRGYFQAVVNGLPE